MQRGGILYGAVDDDNNVMVDVIYEPAQSATATTLQLERGTDEEARADYLAAALGYEVPRLLNICAALHHCDSPSQQTPYSRECVMCATLPLH